MSETSEQLVSHTVIKGVNTFVTSWGLCHSLQILNLVTVYLLWQTGVPMWFCFGSKKTCIQSKNSLSGFQFLLCRKGVNLVSLLNVQLDIQGCRSIQGSQINLAKVVELFDRYTLFAIRGQIFIELSFSATGISCLIHVQINCLSVTVPIHTCAANWEPSRSVIFCTESS